MTDDLVAVRVEHRGLAFEDRDEGVGPIADREQGLPRLRRPLLAERGQRLELSRGENRADRTAHALRVVTRI